MPTSGLPKSRRSLLVPEKLLWSGRRLMAHAEAGLSYCAHRLTRKGPDPLARDATFPASKSIPPIASPTRDSSHVRHAENRLLVSAYAKSRLSGEPFECRGRSWPLATRDGLFHDPLASCSGHHGADR